MRQFTREDILKDIRSKIDKKEPIVAFGAGAGLIAKAAQDAGTDFIYTASTAKLRADGFATACAVLPFMDSNEITKKMAERLLPIMDKTPVIAGVCAFDVYRDTAQTVREMMSLGYSGITNIPSVGMYGDEFRSELAESGIDYGKEAAMVKACSEQGIFTAAFAYTPEDAAVMASAGADIVIAKYQHKEKGNESGAFKTLKKIAEAARKVRRDAIVIIQSCPFTSVEQVQQALTITGAQGFIGASSIERAPAQETLNQVFSEMLSLKR